MIGIVDSNADPDMVDFPIPMNDDAVGAIKLVVDALVGAVERGKKSQAMPAGRQESRIKSQEKESK